MRRWLWLAVLVVGAVAASKIVVENLLGIDVAPLASRWIAAPGPVSALAIVALLVLDLFIPVPSSLVMVLSGAVFGTAWGALLSTAGSMGGAVLGFELARRYGRGAAARLVGERQLERMRLVVDRHGVAAVLATRGVPVAMEAMSVVAGLSRMHRPRFLLASLAGTVPFAVVYGYAGAMSERAGSIAPGLMVVGALAVAAWLVHRRMLTGQPAAKPPASIAASATRFRARGHDEAGRVGGD